jgi:diguanylate cyclase (GGDEF)-like protein
MGESPDQREVGRRRLMGRVAGILFLVGSAMSALGILLPHAAQADVRGFWILAGATAAAGVGLLLAADLISRRGYEGVMVIASLAVTLSLYLNGEIHGAPAAGNQVLYVWVGLYSGYFLSRRALAAQLTVVASLYGAVLLIVHPGSVIFTRWLITVGMVSVAAVIVQYLKRHNDDLLERLSKAARTDPLTGLMNRQGFDETIVRELTRGARNGAPTALIVLDIDRFKDINDRSGHAAGDEALRRIGVTVGQVARGVDTLARIGGDEFAIILPDTHAEGALGFAERLREAVAVPPRPGLALTLSLGIAQAEVDGQTADSLIRAADAALYHAKELGRNQTVAAPGARAAIRTRARTLREVAAHA